MVVFRRLIPVILFLCLMGCQTEKVVSSEVPRNNDRIVTKAPKWVCKNTDEHLCPFKYSIQRRNSRKSLKQEILNLPKTSKNICDLSAYKPNHFKEFEKKTYAAHLILFEGDIVHKNEASALIAKGEWTEINIANSPFAFARNISLHPKEKHDEHHGSSSINLYDAYFEPSENFKYLEWNENAWFGSINLNKGGQIANLWIEKMMRTFEHLHIGSSYNKELRYEHYRENKEIISRNNRNFGYTYNSYKIDYTLGSPMPSYSKSNIDLDSDIFSSVRDFQDISDAIIYVGDQEIFIETHSPRRIVARISADRPIAEYKICPERIIK